MKTDSEQKTFSTRDACRISGITPRQAQWWSETGIVSPKIVKHRRVFTAEQVLTMGVAAELNRKGMSISLIRRLSPSQRWRCIVSVVEAESEW